MSTAPVARASRAREIPIMVEPGPLSAAAHDHHDHLHGHDEDISASVPGPAPVWLRVGEIEISEADIAREMQMHRADSPHRAREEAARTLVLRTLVRLECERLGIEAQPVDGEAVDEALVRQLIDRELDSPTPDEASVRQFFEANRERLHQPDRIRVRHILLAAAPDDIRARTQARERAETIIAELKRTLALFDMLAAQHSACPSREQGGDLGWVERGDTVPEFERQLFMLRPGLAGLSLETRYGHHVVCVDGIEKGEPLSWDEAAPRISAYLETQARQHALHGYLEQLHARYPVSGWELFAAND